MLDPGLALVSLLSLLLLSGFFSGAETALLAANRYRVSYLARQGDTRAQKVRELLDNRERVLSTMLVGNNFAIIAASALATAFAVGLAGDEGAIYATIVMTFLVLIFAEIAPKTFATRHPQRVAFAIAPLIRIFVKILHPLASFAVAIANGVLMSVWEASFRDPSDFRRGYQGNDFSWRGGSLNRSREEANAAGRIQA